MTYEERAHRRIEAVKKKEEDLLRLERARYSVQELMYEAEEVLRAAVQRVGRSGLPPAMVRAVERAFSSVNEAVHAVELADLRSTFPAHPESRRTPIKPSAIAEADAEAAPAGATRAAPARAARLAARAEARQPKPRKAEPAEARKVRAATKASQKPERAEVAPAKPPKAATEQRRARKLASVVPLEQPQLPLVDLPSTPAPEAEAGPQPAPRHERRKAPVGVA